MGFGSRRSADRLKLFAVKLGRQMGTDSVLKA
jgi:hypothetical protein